MPDATSELRLPASRPISRVGKSADQRRRILVAAVDTFADVGYQQAKRADIADRASIPLSTMEYYFRGKEVLFNAALVTVLARSTQTIANARESRPADDPLEVFITTDLAWWAQHSRAARLVSRRYQRSDWPASRKLFNEWEVDRHDLAFGRRAGVPRMRDVAAREAMRRQARRILHLRLALDLALAQAIGGFAAGSLADLTSTCLMLLNDCRLATPRTAFAR